LTIERTSEPVREGGLVKWLLDTNTVSEITKPKPSEPVIQWLEQNETESAISVVTIGEMVIGVEGLLKTSGADCLNAH